MKNDTMIALCGMPLYSIRLEVGRCLWTSCYFLHSTMPCVTCLWLGDVSALETFVTMRYINLHLPLPLPLPLSAVLLIFSFQLRSDFLPCRHASRSVLVYAISEIGRCLKFGEVNSCTRRTAHAYDFEFILTVIITRAPQKMRTWTWTFYDDIVHVEARAYAH